MSEEQVKEAIEKVKKIPRSGLIRWLDSEYDEALEEVLYFIDAREMIMEEIKDCANWHISHITEDIKDYIDDDKNGNADIIAELEEQREHWRDIIRITKNEKTYMDYLEG